MNVTELTQRKQKILAAIIESYIATGEPVGSKTLLGVTGIDVSPATVRNDMAELASNGFIIQPHTSAGRIPSQKGFRYYVDNLMSEKLPPQRACDYIDAKLSGAADSPENLLSSAARALSDYSGLAAVTTTPPADGARIHRVQFLATGRHTAMAVVVTTTGIVRSKLFRLSLVVTGELVSVLGMALNKALAGVPLEEVNRPFMQSVAASFGELAMLAPQALIAVMDIVSEAQLTQLCVSGETKLLFMPGFDVGGAGGVLGFLSDSDRVSRLLLSQSRGLRIIMGRESKSPELGGCTVTAARYEIGGRPAGAVALFGPLRMDYAAAAGAVSYTAKAVGSYLDEMMEI